MSVVTPGDLSDVEIPLVGLALDCAPGTRLPRHRHLRHQLLFASEGVMRAEVESGIWIVPPHRAVWIPAGVTHEVHAIGNLAMRTLYFHPDASRPTPTGCRVIEVPPLLRELVLRVVAVGRLVRSDRRHRSLLALVLDEINELPVLPLHLPEPTDRRLLQIARAIRREPADDRSLAAWGRSVGASSRTLARRFRAETGMSFGRWRQQARLVMALERLAEGRSVKLIAPEVGYASSSAFVAMFRRALGTMPGRYFEAISSAGE